MTLAGAASLMTDIDNTSGKAHAWYADNRLIAADKDVDLWVYCPWADTSFILRVFRKQTKKTCF